MRNDQLRSNTRTSRPIHRGDARSGTWGLAVLATVGATFSAAALGGCVSDPDCGVCDPENLILETIAGSNYAGKVVKLLGPECEGDDCPAEITKGNYFVEKVIPCVETEDALASPRGIEEWCKVSPLIVTDGLQFVFNNLLDPQSIELVRKAPANPQLYEVYDWKSRIVHLEGPIARYNGDYHRAGSQTQPDRLTRLVSLSCIDNLADLGQPFTYKELNAGVCDGTFADPKLKKTIPLKMRAGQEVKTYAGETDGRRVSQSCTTPQDGVDTCCDACDFELSVNVAKYGVTQPIDELTQAKSELKRTPNGNGAAALTCDPMGDKFADCRDFIPHVYRAQEVRQFSFDWNGDGQVDEKTETFRLPMQDKLRETHPDDRPKGYEQETVPCQTREDCAATPSPNLTGMDCVGRNDQGKACTGNDPSCTDKHCAAEWFVECRADADTTGTGGFCVDRRWSGQGVAACFTTTVDYPICVDETCTQTNGNDGKGRRFAFADADTDNFVAATEGCRSKLSDGEVQDKAPCDPFFQSKVVPNTVYDRKETLPSASRNCKCEDDPADGCADIVAQLCHEGGDPSKPLIKEKVGQYALKFVSRPGGVVYDPAVKGVLFLPADLGAIPRSFVEGCSEGRAKGAGGLNIKDGWRGNDANFFESFENFDRSMCSSSTYKVVFSEPDPKNPVQYIRDKVGNTLVGKSTYVLHTPDFHVVPGSGFPTDNLRIGACDDFEIRVSNKYDMSPINMQKLQIIELGGTDTDPVEGNVVAGGLGCAETKDEVGGGKVPCLTVNIRDQEIGAIRVEIDAKEFGAVLKPRQRYRLRVPGLVLGDGEDVYDAMKNRPDDYRNAFWDACGMPLVLGMPKLNDKGEVSGGGKAASPDYFYDFAIDAPKCKEDKDLDNYQFSCDNAPDHRNPDQLDVDGDGFGDLIDLCVSVPSDVNTADRDKDGLGNDCDRCTRTPNDYNKNAADAMAPAYMLVRNVPDQSDFDGDGVGDACDNCIVRSNCGDFGNDKMQTAEIGDPIPFDNKDTCQVDNDTTPYVGDACIENNLPVQEMGAGGPVGIGPMDDFDQDGLVNMSDKCPRQRLAACTDAADCGAGVACTANVCEDHVDSDNDGVGDACDTCPYDANPKQIQEGAAQDDDPDGDFVGNPCETNSECYDRSDARPIAFYSKVASSGMCCTTQFKDDLTDAPRLAASGEFLLDEEVEALLEQFRMAQEAWAMTMTGPEPLSPIFVPLKADCGGETPDKCRQLPDKVKTRPGVVDLPEGCTEAGQPLNLNSPEIKGNVEELYKHMCTLPQFDQDFDGIGDKCDLCPYSFDPDNTLYKDQNNKVWPNYGKYCRGVWDPEAAPRRLTKCGDEAEGGGGDTDTDTGGGSGGTG